jgi:hypothetical protein
MGVDRDRGDLGRGVEAMTSEREAVERTYLAATRTQRRQGFQWYVEARKVAHKLARDHETTFSRAAGVIAALSPRTRWAVNVEQAGLLLGGSKRVFGTMSDMLKARRIARGERPLQVLRGPKVRGFYKAIVGDVSSVAVDRHCAKVCGLGPKLALGQYRRIEQAIREVAAKYKRTPSEVQAVIWIVGRGTP